MTLPNFLIIGAARSGTTSLYHYLRQHPDIYLSPIKEPCYWCGGLPRSREEYERLFDGAGGRRAVGEASPTYLNSPTAAARVAAELPHAKVIVSLRNPADRAYSSYLGHRRAATESRPPDEALHPGSYYFDSSLYFERLLRWLERFPDTKVIVFDDFAADPRGVVRNLFDYLGVGDFEIDVSRRHNAAAVPRLGTLNAVLCRSGHAVRSLLPTSRLLGWTTALQRPLLRPPEPLPAHVRQRLLEAFAPDIEKTAKLIGRDLSHWR